MLRGHRLSRRAAVIAVLAMLAIVVSACQTGTTSAAPDKLQQVISAGKVRVGDCLSFAPFGFMDENGKPAGYDVDIATEMAKQLGVELEMVDTTADNRIPNLQTDKVDVVICNFTENPTRAKQINFTIPYVIAGEVLLVKKDSDINGIKDLDGKKVAVVTGSTNAEIIAAANPKATTQSYPTSAAAVLAVKSGQADAMVEDSNFQTYQAKLDPTLRVTNDSLIPLEHNGFGVAQGQFNWLEWQNQFLFWLNHTGKNTELYTKWFGMAPLWPVEFEAAPGLQ